MRLLVSGIIIVGLLLAFVFTWIYNASLGRVPVIQAPLESVSPVVRIVVLVLLAAVVAVIYFRMSPGTKRTE